MSGQLNAFWRLTGRRVFARLGMRAITAAIKVGRAVDVEDWPSAGTSLNRIRQIIRFNLPLGLIVVVIGGSGRYWG
jgi:uncharacterized membrane protein